MSVAYFIELDDENLDLATAVDGKLLAHAADDLNALALRIGLEPLDTFLGASDEMLDAFDVDPDTVPDANRWFDAEHGIRWFASMADRLQKFPNAVDDAAALIAELEDFKNVLERVAVAEAGAKWHLAVDI